MAAEVNPNYFAWSQEELAERDGSQGVSVAQMLEHGSVSFGKFKFEALSWEKWSVFTHDRRQEELEKFNGLVAEKKAFFEEYYKQMRALKALQQQQEQEQRKLESQQTELTLDYGEESSNSSQAEEEAGQCDEEQLSAEAVEEDGASHPEFLDEEEPCIEDANANAASCRDEHEAELIVDQEPVSLRSTTSEKPEEADHGMQGSNAGLPEACEMLEATHEVVQVQESISDRKKSAGVVETAGARKRLAYTSSKDEAARKLGARASNAAVKKAQKPSTPNQPDPRSKQRATKPDKVPSLQRAKPPPTPPPRPAVVASSARRAPKEVPGAAAARRYAPSSPQRRAPEKQANAATALRRPNSEAVRQTAAKANHRPAATGSTIQAASPKPVVPIIVRSSKPEAKRHIDEAGRAPMTPGRYSAILKKMETERATTKLAAGRPSTGSKMPSKVSKKPAGAERASKIPSRPSTGSKRTEMHQPGKIKSSSVNLPSRQELRATGAYEQRAVDRLILLQRKQPVRGTGTQDAVQPRTVIEKRSAHQSSLVRTSKVSAAQSLSVNGTKPKSDTGRWR